MKTEQTIPPDVMAYLRQSAVDLANEQGFQPNDETELALWMEFNHKEIGQRARNAMQKLADKLLGRPDLMQLASDHISKKVYNLIPKDGPAQWNPRYAKYAQAHGCTPEQMLERDGGKMTNFLCWKG